MYLCLAFGIELLYVVHLKFISSFLIKSLLAKRRKSTVYIRMSSAVLKLEYCWLASQSLSLGTTDLHVIAYTSPF